MVVWSCLTDHEQQGVSLSKDSEGGACAHVRRQLQTVHKQLAPFLGAQADTPRIEAYPAARVAKLCLHRQHIAQLCLHQAQHTSVEEDEVYTEMCAQLEDILGTLPNDLSKESSVIRQQM